MTSSSKTPAAKSFGSDARSAGQEYIRYVEVRGCAQTETVRLSANEWLKAKQLGADCWLYIVTHALAHSALYLVQGPVRRLPGEEGVPLVRYQVTQNGWHRVAEVASEHGPQAQ